MRSEAVLGGDSAFVTPNREGIRTLLDVGGDEETLPSRNRFPSRGSGEQWCRNPFERRGRWRERREYMGNLECAQSKGVQTACRAGCDKPEDDAATLAGSPLLPQSVN